MKPDVPVALQKLSMTLLVEIAPQVGVEYLQRNSALAAIMLQMAAEEFDRAAARRVEENGAMRALFGNAAPGVGLSMPPPRGPRRRSTSGTDRLPGSPCAPGRSAADS